MQSPYAAARILDAQGRPKLLAILLLFIGLSACQEVGPKSIKFGRPNYNKVLWRTGIEQAFTNLVRAHNNEPVYFMEVIEVDAAVTAQAAANGGINGMGVNQNNTSMSGKNGRGSTGTFAGNIGGSVQYQEQPTIRYQPLQGQALVTQIESPITVDSLAYLYDSERPLSSILAFTVDRLTPGYETYASALNAIIELYDYGVLILAAGRADKAPGVPAPAPGRAQPPRQRVAAGAEPDNARQQQTPNDTLFIYLSATHPSPHGGQLIDAERQILHLWLRLLQIYEGSQRVKPKKPLPDIAADINRVSDERSYENVLAEMPSYIELRTQVLPQEGSVPLLAPTLRMRSAIGALRWAVQQIPPLIDFVTVDQYKAITQQCWNGGVRDFYTILPSAPAQPSQTPPLVGSPTVTDAIKSRVAAQLQTQTGFECSNKTSDYNVGTLNFNENVANDDDVYAEKALNQWRRYILVIQSPSQPENSYVSDYDDHHKLWYYIDNDDLISKRNFEFLMQLLTMQAVAPAPLATPSISIGAH